MSSKKFVDPLTLVNVTTTQRDALTGTATGDIIYNSTVGGSQLLIGGTWQSDLLATGLAGGQSLAGGTGSSDVLLLRGSTSSIFGGTLSINSPINGFASDQTVTAQIGSAFKIANTYTLNFATPSFGGGSGSFPGVFDVSPTLLVQQNGASFLHQAFRTATTIKNVAGSGTTSLGATAGFKSTQTVTAVTDTVALPATADFFSRWIFSTATSGVLNLANDYVNYEAGITISDSGVNVSGTYAAFGFLGPSVTGGTLANVTGLRVGAHATGSTTSYGVDIGALTGAGANIGVRIAKPSGGTQNTGLQNTGSTVFPPTVSTMSAVGSTIDASSTVARLNNTSGGSLTLTSAPTIAAGVDGQILIVYNSSAQNVVISDQATLASSGLKLASTTFTITTRDTITLVYSSTNAAWLEVSRAVVL